MITTNGFRKFVEFASGYAPSFGEALALGVGTVAPSADDTSLASEVYRIPIDLKSPDFVNGAVICRATIPQEYTGKVYEAGLVTARDQKKQRLIQGGAGEEWSGVEWDATHARVGAEAAKLSPAASSSLTSTVEKQFDIEHNDITFNYYVGPNTTGIFLRLRTSNADFYNLSLPNSLGYHSITAPLSSFTITGNPEKSNITSVLVGVSATAAGAGELHIDGLMLSSPEDEEDLLARQVLSQPIITDVGTEVDIEFTVDFNLL